MSAIETQLAEARRTIEAHEWERASDLEDLRRLQAAYDALHRQLATAQALEAYWKQKHADAWTLIGRLDYALEQIAAAKGIRGARQWARKMRQEIAERVGKGTTK